MNLNNIFIKHNFIEKNQIKVIFFTQLFTSLIVENDWIKYLKTELFYME